MFEFDEEKRFHLTRGQAGTLTITSTKGNFKTGDILKLSIVEKGKYDQVVFQKKVEITEEGIIAKIPLSSKETKIGEVISNKKTYYYEVELNGEDHLICHDASGAKELILYPEAGDMKEGNN